MLERLKYHTVDQPGLHLLGAVISTVLLVGFGYTFGEAASFLFWWYLACSATIGIWTIWVAFIALGMSFTERDTPVGWNAANRPSLHGLPEVETQVFGQVYDTFDQTQWQSYLKRVGLIISVHSSLPLGAFFLKQYAGDETMILGKLGVAIFLLIYGSLMYHRQNH
jgi:hypothetical protein